MIVTPHIDMTPSAELKPAYIGEMSGDDLLAARAFVDAAQRDITQLLDPDNHALPNIALRLSRIITLAKAVSARAVDRAAQLALDMSQSKVGFEKSAQWQGQILVLNKLISQYGIGLRQVEAELENTVASLNSGGAQICASVENSSGMALKEQFHAAQSTLKPLLKFAETDTQRNALSRLAKLDSAVTKQFKTDVGAKQIKQADIPFEAIMPSFTASALRAARQSDKIVSISFGAEGPVNIAAEQCANMDNLLCGVASGLVNQWLERPDVRQSRGESGAGHIAVTANRSNTGLNLQFSLRTSIARDFDFASMAVKAAPLGAHWTSQNDDNSATLTLRFDRNKQPAPVRALSSGGELTKNSTLGDALSEAII